jgi:hypothetical protein
MNFSIEHALDIITTRLKTKQFHQCTYLWVIKSKAVQSKPLIKMSTGIMSKY